MTSLVPCEWQGFDQILKKADVQPALQRGRILPGVTWGVSGSSKGVPGD